MEWYGHEKRKEIRYSVIGPIMNLRKSSPLAIVALLSVFNAACFIFIAWLLMHRAQTHSSFLPITPDYTTLTVEELAMRYRFPDFYVRDNGEGAPGVGAFFELLRRRVLHKGLKKEEVLFLLGDPYNTDGDNSPSSLDHFLYGTLGGNFVVEFEEGRLVRVLQTHDGEPDHAHTDVLLK